MQTVLKYRNHYKYRWPVVRIENVQNVHTDLGSVFCVARVRVFMYELLYFLWTAPGWVCWVITFSILILLSMLEGKSNLHCYLWVYGDLAMILCLED